MNWVNFSIIVAALVSGFLGANLVDIITKKVGLTKSMDIRVNGQSMYFADLNERQIKAIEYLNKYGRITNDIYQKINKISHSSARNDLANLVKAKKIKKLGKGKGTYYVL